jgi:DNA-binding transcriptional MerR regulator
MNTFSTSQVAKRFGVADQTVKNWAAEFAAYLSPTATPEPGKKRAFTVEDVAVFALVHDMVGRGRDPEAAHAALSAGQRGTNSALVQAQTGDNLIVVQQERDRLQGAVMELRAQLTEARSDRDELVSKLAETELLLKLYRKRGRIEGDDE